MEFCDSGCTGFVFRVGLGLGVDLGLEVSDLGSGLESGGKRASLSGFRCLKLRGI